MIRILLPVLAVGFAAMRTGLIAAGEDPERRAVVAWVDSLGGRCLQTDAGEITGVDLRNAWLTDADLEKLARLPNLESIQLGYTKITDLGLEKLTPLENVKVLDLRYAENITDAGIAHLRHWTGLEHLDVRGTKVTSSLFEHLSKMRKLRFLDVAHTRVSDERFEELIHLERLERFAFGGNKMSGVALPLLESLPSLRELDVSGEQRTDSGLWSVSVTDFNIEAIARLRRLEALDLGETDISDRGVARLAELKDLRELDLSGTRVTGKGIAALAKLPELRHLKLWRAEGIDDAAVESLLELENLEVLELPETRVTAEGLSRLSGLKDLEKLFIGGLDVTRDEVEALRAALPGCFVSWWRTPEISAEER